MKKFDVTVTVSVEARNAKTAADKGRKLLRSHACPTLELSVRGPTEEDNGVFIFTPKVKEVRDEEGTQLEGTPGAVGEAPEGA